MLGDITLKGICKGVKGNSLISEKFYAGLVINTWILSDSECVYVFCDPIGGGPSSYRYFVIQVCASICGTYSSGNLDFTKSVLRWILLRTCIFCDQQSQMGTETPTDYIDFQIYIHILNPEDVSSYSVGVILTREDYSWLKLQQTWNKFTFKRTSMTLGRGCIRSCCSHHACFWADAVGVTDLGVIHGLGQGRCVPWVFLFGSAEELRYFPEIWYMICWRQREFVSSEGTVSQCLQKRKRVKTVISLKSPMWGEPGFAGSFFPRIYE